MRRLPRLGVRTRLLLAVVGVVALALAIGVAAFNLLLDQRLTANAIALAKAQAEARVAALTVVNGTLTEPEAPDAAQTIGSPIVGVFRKESDRDSARRGRPSRRPPPHSRAGPQHAARVKETMQLYAVPVVDAGTRVGTVVAGVPLAPYDETATTAFVGSVLLAVLLLSLLPSSPAGSSAGPFCPCPA